MVVKNFLVLTFIVADIASAAPKQRSSTVEDFEKAIDRFESEMLKRDREEFSFGADGQPRQEQDEPALEVKGNSQKIEAIPPGAKELESIAASLNRIDNEIDTLSKDVEAFRNKAFRNSTAGNIVDLDVILNSPETARLRSLSVKLDGFELYSTNDSANLPLPAIVVPVYSGPLQPGGHKLEISSRIALAGESSSAPLNTFAYKNSTKTFDLSIDEGSFRRRYTIEIVPPKDRKDPLNIELKQGGETASTPPKENAH
jgi:hypothetical protein